MNAAVAGFVKGKGYLFKCPICGVVLEDRPWRCPECDTVLETYRTDMFSTIQNPKVCVDFHGVVMDMLGALVPYLKEKYGVTFDPASVTDYDFDCDLGFDRKLVFEAFQDEALHNSLKLCEGADIGLKMLKSRCVPVAYTGVVNKIGIISYYNRLIIDLGLSGRPMPYKKPVIYDANVLFDDCVGVHRQWYSSGFRGLQYLIDMPYNQQNGAVGPEWGAMIRVPSFKAGVIDMFRRFGWPMPEMEGVSMW